MKLLYNKATDHVPKDAVYIGRPSKFGNPFIIGKDGSRSEVIEKYKKYLYSNTHLLAAVCDELEGKALVCWCSPESCHGDVILDAIRSRQLSDIVCRD